MSKVDRITSSYVNNSYVGATESTAFCGIQGRVKKVKAIALAFCVMTLCAGGAGTYAAGSDSVTVEQMESYVKEQLHHFYSVDSTDSTAKNYDNTGAKSQNAVAIGVGASAVQENSVAIGNNAYIDGNGGNETGASGIAIGDTATITTNGLNLTSIAIGKNARVLNGSGKQDKTLSFTPDNYSNDSLPLNADKVPGGIAIGVNSFARTASIHLGSHTLEGYRMGGQTIDSNSQGQIVGMTTIGTNTYNKGALANMVGGYSVINGSFKGGGGFFDRLNGSQNFGANIIGSLNSIRSQGYSNNAGIANSIVGFANIAENSNGTLIYGAGNKVTNSNATLNGVGVSSFGEVTSVDEMVNELQKGIQSSDGGGATLAIGGGNTADWTKEVQLIGVNNTVTGTSDNLTEFTMVTGYKNTVTKAKHVTLMGSGNSISEGVSNVVIGDNHTLTKGSNNIIIGSMPEKKDARDTSSEKGAVSTEHKQEVSNAVMIGYSADAQVNDSVALGANSVATRNVEAELNGYDPATKTNSTVADSIWKPTAGEVSIGNGTTTTRRITSVAAGVLDTDAVNVAQLKAVVANAGGGSGSVVVDGVVEKDNTGIVNGGTVYKETRPEKDGAYIKTTVTAGENLVALDAQVKANTETIATFNNTINGIATLDKRMDKVGAGAAALAALHPLDFDPEDKLVVSAGVGAYQGANALALGAFYRPNDRMMVSLGGAFGTGENMINAGVSVRIGNGSEYSGLSKAELVQRLDSMDKENKELREQMKMVLETLTKLEAK